MSFFKPQPGDVVKPNGVIIRTCDNGSTMTIGTGNELAGMFDEDHKRIFAELEAEPDYPPLPADYVRGEWWD